MSELGNDQTGLYQTLLDAGLDEGEIVHQVFLLFAAFVEGVTKDEETDKITLTIHAEHAVVTVPAEIEHLTSRPVLN